MNQAVVNGYRYHGMQALVDGLMINMADIEALSTNELLQLAKDMQMYPEEGQSTSSFLQDMLTALAGSMATMQRRAVINGHVQDVLFGEGTGVKTAVDHMASAMSPALVDGEAVVGDDAAIAAAVIEQVRARLNPAAAAPVEATVAPEADGTPLERLVPEHGVAVLDRSALRSLLAKYPFQNKLHGFLVKQIDHLLPEDLRVFIGDAAAIAAKQAQLFPGVDLGGDNEVGVYFRGTVFMKNSSEETLVHELIHATTLGLIRQFYAGAAGMTSQQKTAVQALEVLAREFIELPNNQAYGQPQSVVRMYLRSGRVGDAVNEFMAWSLTNQDVANALHQTAGSSKLKAMAKKLLAAVRKLLGLPGNAAVESFLEQTLGRFQQLIQKAEFTPDDGQALFQSMEGPADIEHAQHVLAMRELFQKVIDAVPASTPVTNEYIDQMRDAYLQADAVRSAFLDAGFEFTQQEQLLFELAQVALTSAAKLDPATLNGMHTLYASALSQLRVQDFMADPSSTDEGELQRAQTRFDALKGSETGTMRINAQGRSNLLANFIALGLAYKPLRDRLAAIQVTHAKEATDTLDAKLRAVATKAFNWISDISADLHKTQNQRQALELLARQLQITQEAATQEARSPGAYTKLQGQLKDRLEHAGAKAEAKLRERHAAGLVGGADGLVNSLLNAVKGMTSDEGAAAVGESLLQWANASGLPKALSKLVVEAVGITDSNAAVAALLSQGKHAVARVRQRLRDEAPAQIREWFSKPLTSEQWEQLHTSVGKTDLQSLLGAYSVRQIHDMAQDGAVLAQAIASLESQLGANAARYSAATEHLATWLIEGKSTAPGMWYSNAEAMVRLLGQGIQVSPEEVARLEDVVDRLTTLKALNKLGLHERTQLAELLATEKVAMVKLLKQMERLVHTEKTKPDADRQAFNYWKGAVPVSQDPRTELVLATANQAFDLVKRGYRKVGDYHGDAHDPAQGMAYYATKLTGGPATYNQGALQTVEGTVSGVDRVTGRTLDSSIKTVISHAPTVRRITAAKARGNSSAGTGNLRPLFNMAGDVVAYERTLDRNMLDQHLKGRKDLSKSIGMWLGRQTVEALAAKFNSDLVNVLKAQWDAERGTRRDEYVDISNASTVLDREVWEAVPRETQKQLEEVFEGPVMVRKDMLDMTLGNRSASVSDVFTGLSDLSAETRQVLMTAAYGTLGKNAYQILVGAERVWQSSLGHAKDWIVVRSGVVALSNAVSNVFQLLQMGIPLNQILPVLVRKTRETETYLRNERRLARITLELGSVYNGRAREALQLEAQQLQDANSRLSIHALIQAGELPTISEGLSEQDEFSLLNDGVEWVKSKTMSLPPGVSTVARYALVAKDTALYQGLSRMLQFGDFVAKAAVYDHSLAQGMDSSAALRKVSESFVNYSLPAGRTRDYLEKMGMTWFMAYKIRIQKIILRTIRENPLSFMLGGGTAVALNVDSLAGSIAPAVSWSYSLGPGQWFRAHRMLIWDQLFGD
jgi:hypothetical protein